MEGRRRLLPEILALQVSKDRSTVSVIALKFYEVTFLSELAYVGPF